MGLSRLLDAPSILPNNLTLLEAAMFFMIDLQTTADWSRDEPVSQCRPMNSFSGIYRLKGKSFSGRGGFRIKHGRWLNVSYHWSKPGSTEGKWGQHTCCTHRDESGFQKCSCPWFLVLWARLHFPFPYSLVVQPILGFQEPRDGSFDWIRLGWDSFHLEPKE